ncbi:MAG: zf-TFIIB domain-containing protein [Gemmatimonadaceae bacterium]
MPDNSPSRNEDEYFVKLDADLIKDQRAKLNTDRERLERRSHYMKCPKCGATLIETDFHHIKIDKCPECGGLWFDRGEIDMLEHIDQSKLRGFVRSLFGLKW